MYHQIDDILNYFILFSLLVFIQLVEPFSIGFYHVILYSPTMTHHIVNLFDMSMQLSDCWEQIEACNSKTCRHLFSHTMHYKDKQPSFNFVHNTLFDHLPWHKQSTDKQISHVRHNKIYAIQLFAHQFDSY
eukprot:464855_1